MNTYTLRSSWWYMLALLGTLSLVHLCASCNAWDITTILIFIEITECSLWTGYSSQTFWEYTEIKDSGLHDQHPTPTPTQGLSWHIYLMVGKSFNFLYKGLSEEPWFPLWSSYLEATAPCTGPAYETVRGISTKKPPAACRDILACSNPLNHPASGNGHTDTISLLWREAL